MSEALEELETEEVGAGAYVVVGKSSKSDQQRGRRK